MYLKRIFKNKFSRELIISLIIQAVYTVITPLSMIVLARLLGPEQFGDFSFTVSVMSLIAIFCTLGFPVLVTRYGAMYYIRQQWSYLKGLISYTNKYIMVTSLLVIIMITSWLLVVDYKSQNYYSILVGLPIILFSSLSATRASLLTAIERVNYSQLPERILRPILFFLLIILLHFFSGLNNLSAIGIYTIVNLVIFVYGVYLVMKFLPHHVKIAVKDYQIGLWKKSAIPLFVLGSVQVLNQHLDIFILGLLTSDDGVGIYKSMYQISILVIFSLSAINAISAPYIIREIEYNQPESLKRLLYKFCALNTIIAIVIALPFLVFGEFLIDLFYGNEYIGGLLCLKILILGRIVNSTFGVSNHFLKMLGEEKRATKGILMGVMLGLILNIVLVPKYGIEGASVASASALIFWNSYLFYSALSSINKLSA